MWPRIERLDSINTLSIEQFPQVDLERYREQRRKLIKLSEQKERCSLADPRSTLAKTRDGVPLETEEMYGLVFDITKGTVSEAQAASWLTSVYINGLTLPETVDLTYAMAASGKVLDLSEFGVVADKHSTGGVGDKTTLPVTAILAACNIPVGKMTGKGLMHTGGTWDKLESIPGFRVELSEKEFLTQLRETGLVIAGQSEDLAPADRILYALRDETATVASIPLIAASIMSKKLASGANILNLDVKVGRGAFMKDMEQARELAQIMVDIGDSCGITCVAQLANMDNQPLGMAVGNALEVGEAIDIMKGEEMKDEEPTDGFHKHCVETAAAILVMCGKADSYEKALKMATEKLRDCSALQKFKEMTIAQGVELKTAEKLVTCPSSVLPQAKYKEMIFSPSNGYIASIDPLQVGLTVMNLGGGRIHKGDPINSAVGVYVFKTVGSQVGKGQPLFTVFADSKQETQQVKEALLSAVTINQTPVQIPVQIYEYVLPTRLQS